MNNNHQGGGSNGISRNVLLFNTGRLFSLEAIRHHINTVHGPVTGAGKDAAKAMIDFLRKKQYDHMVLYHDPVVKAVVNDLFSTDKSIDGKSTLELHKEDTDEVNQFV